MCNLRAVIVDTVGASVADRATFNPGHHLSRPSQTLGAIGCYFNRCDVWIERCTCSSPPPSEDTSLSSHFQLYPETARVGHRRMAVQRLPGIPRPFAHLKPADRRARNWQEAAI